MLMFFAAKLFGAGPQNFLPLLNNLFTITIERVAKFGNDPPSDPSGENKTKKKEIAYWLTT